MGTYQPRNGSTGCENCTVGRYTSRTVSTECEACHEGDFAPEVGSLSCKSCASSGGPEGAGGAGYSSASGAASCDKASASYYLVADGTAVSCPDGTDCDGKGGTLSSLRMGAGWYRFTPESTLTFQCTHPLNCRGGNATGDSLCAEGAGGPLCDVCEPR